MLSLESYPRSSYLANDKSRIEGVYIYISNWRGCWMVFFREKLYSLNSKDIKSLFKML
jgi:hypothetical protein